MRFVLYDDEDMEPITVLNVPWLSDAELAKIDYRIRLAPMPAIDFSRGLGPENPPTIEKLEIVTIKFEEIRRGRNHTWMAFTQQAALAMLLNPHFLPGQRRAVRDIEAQRDVLYELLMQQIRG